MSVSCLIPSYYYIRHTARRRHFVIIVIVWYRLLTSVAYFHITLFMIYTNNWLREPVDAIWWTNHRFGGGTVLYMIVDSAYFILLLSINSWRYPSFSSEVCTYLYFIETIVIYKLIFSPTNSSALRTIVIIIVLLKN